MARFAAGRVDGIGFVPISTDRAGGHRPVDVKLTARNARTQTFVFDIITPRVNVVTTAADFGAGTLRAAIEDVNDTPFCGTDVPCVISFSETTTLIIAPATPLPPIRKCNLFIRGPDDAEFVRPAKRVAISGENATWGNGLVIRTPPCPIGGVAGGVSLSGVAVHSWPWNGIVIDGTSGQPGVAHHSIRQTYVGTDHTGQVARPNGGRGIVLDSPHATLFLAGGIAGTNGRSGIALFAGRHAQISNMQIAGNGASGIFSFSVPFQADFNTITGNAHFGIAVARGTPEARIDANAIHTNGGLPIDWALDDRTPADDETDGVPNTPRIVDAVYDASQNETVIRGEVRLRGATFGERYLVQAFLASSIRGDLPTGHEIGHQAVVMPEGVADRLFEISVRGDLRGKLIALQLHGISDQTLVRVSSEISEAVAVR